MPAKFFAAATIATCMASFSLTHAQDTTDPVGYNTVTIPGNQISLVSFNLTKPSLYQRAITAVSGPVITDAQQTWPAANTLPAGEFGALNSDNKPLYYVEFRSGEFADGLLIDIIGINRTNNTLTLKDDVSILLDGNESYAIRKHTTFADAFGPANSAGFLGGNTAASADQLYWIDSNGNWVGNFYKTGLGANWRRVGGDASTKSDSIVPLKGGIYVVRKDAAPLNVIVSGQVKVRSAGTDIIGFAQIEIYPGNNLVSNIWPVEFTLANSNLHTGDPETGMRGGNSAASGDVVYVMKNSAWVGYYVKTGLGPGWRAIDGNVSIDPKTIVIKPGEAVYIVRRGTTGFTWDRDLADTQN